MNREQKMIRSSWWAIVGNAVLAALKLVVGLVSGSYAVIADGIDSVSDIVSSLVVLFAAKIISRPPNIKFVYGYQKADTMAAKVISFFIFFAGAQLAWSTVKNFLSGEPQQIPGLLAIWVSIISIAGKLIMTFVLHRTGKKVDSPMLIANARNMRNDILISLGVLTGLIFTITLDQVLIDRAIALAISIFIIFSAIRIFLETNTDLMDGIDDPGVYSRLFEAVNQVKGASNPHRVRARKIGIYYMVNLDIEVEPSTPVQEAHLIAKNVEESIKSGIRNVYDVMVHIEPHGNQEADERFGITEKDIKKPFRKRK